MSNRIDVEARDATTGEVWFHTGFCRRGQVVLYLLHDPDPDIAALGHELGLEGLVLDRGGLATFLVRLRDLTARIAGVPPEERSSRYPGYQEWQFESLLGDLRESEERLAAVYARGVPVTVEIL